MANAPFRTGPKIGRNDPCRGWALLKPQQRIIYQDYLIKSEKFLRQIPHF